jgi:hypothetical protein
MLHLEGEGAIRAGAVADLSGVGVRRIVIAGACRVGVAVGSKCRRGLGIIEIDGLNTT